MIGLLRTHRRVCLQGDLQDSEDGSSLHGFPLPPRYHSELASIVFFFSNMGPLLRQKNNIEEALKAAGGRVAELRKMA